MSNYWISGKSFKEILEFIEYCKENDIYFEKFSSDYKEVKRFPGSEDTCVYAELETGIPKDELYNIKTAAYREKNLEIGVSGPVLKNLDREINTIKEIGDLHKEIGDFEFEDDGLVDEGKRYIICDAGRLWNGGLVEKVEARLGEYHALLTVLKQIEYLLIEEGIYGGNDLSFANMLGLVSHYLSIVAINPELTKISDRLNQKIEQMIGAINEHLKIFENKKYIARYLRMLKEIWEVEDEFDIDEYDDLSVQRWVEIEHEYYVLCDEFLEKLNVFFGQNTSFKIPEKVVF